MELSSYGLGSYTTSSSDLDIPEEILIENKKEEHEDLGSYINSIKDSPKTTKENVIGTLPGYQILKILGSGFHGHVYEAIRDSDSKKVALKTVEIKKEEQVEELIREVDILVKISNPCQPFLVCFNRYEYLKDRKLFLIDTNLIEGKTLYKFAESLKSSDKFNRYLLLIIKDIIKPIKYLHNNGIFHNDIKTY